MEKSIKTVPRKVGIDIVLFLIVGLGAYCYYNFTPVYKRGFFCDDDSIRYPYKTSTISDTLLYFISFLVPKIGMIIGEIFHSRNSKSQLTLYFRGFKISPWMIMVYRKIGIFAVGGLANIVISEIPKIQIGRLRPYFIEICNPSVDCTNPDNLKTYHVDFECRNKTSQHLWHNARMSFPSGHAAYVMYGMISFALYLQLRMTWKGSKLLRHLLQGLCLWTAWSISLSRVSDYKHHWTDVLAGMILGAIVALVNVFFVGDYLFNEQQGSKKHQTHQSTVETISRNSIGSNTEPSNNFINNKNT